MEFADFIVLLKIKALINSLAEFKTEIILWNN